MEELHPDLLLAKALIYLPCGYACSAFRAEKESSDYGAAAFCLNNRSVAFRAAHITPAKTGQFVTLWKRNSAGITQPHHESDGIDLAVISARKEQLFGQFVFPKDALIKYGILSTSKKEGKRGFRIYPPWDKAENPQAIRTQQWQAQFFLEVMDGCALDRMRANLLYEVGEKATSI
jgi:hypothetical protein